MLGLVDRIAADYAYVEFQDNDTAEIRYVEIPLMLFPCDIKEGDLFYTTEIDGVTEIRCGKPPI